jgi:long-chain acyl-CoA synthetase
VLGESRDTLARDCQLVHPTALNAVPFLYQRIAEKIMASALNSPPSQGGVGGGSDVRHRDPLTQPLPQGERREFESAALRHFFGGRMERLTSGGAPLAPNVEAWYAEQDLPVLQGYGLTEASPVISVSTFPAYRFGSVGKPLPGMQVRIAADGEVLLRGPNVMLGYWHDEPATADAIRDGWLQTGDLGELDRDNFLFIRGRKKELIVLSTGKKVLPTRVENLLTASPMIEQAAVFGDGMCGLVALIVPAAAHHGASATCVLADNAKAPDHESFAAEIKRCLQSAAHEEQVHHFKLLDRPFSIERGEMTPKLSLCRKTIEANFAAELKSMLPQRSQSAQRIG